MKKILFALVLLTIPATIALDSWPDDLHRRYLRNYHGYHIAIATDYSNFLNQKGEYCRLTMRRDR